MAARSIVVLAALSLFFSPGTVPGQSPGVSESRIPSTGAAENDGPKITIKKLSFTGQTGLSPEEEADIVAAVRDKAGEHDPKWLEEFEARLLDAWQERGYFKAKVQAQAREVSAISTEKSFAVTAHVESGRRYFLGEIRFLAGTQFSHQELRSMFPIQAGDLLNTHGIHAGLNALRSAYGERGFIDFSPVPTTTTDELHGRISIEIELEEGRQFRISETRILGLDRASASSLLENSGLEPGNIFNPRLLEDFSQQHPLAEIERRIDVATKTIKLQIDFSQPNQARPPE